MFRICLVICLLFFTGCTINQVDTNDVKETPFTETIFSTNKYKNKKEITASPLNLTYELKEIYLKYSLSKKDQLLKELAPFDILRLKFKAENDSDFEVVYNLINKTTDMPPLEVYLYEVKNNKVLRDNTKETLNRLRDSSYKIEEIIENDNIVYILFTFKDNVEPHSIHYRLEKTDEGIWKIGWLSSQ